MKLGFVSDIHIDINFDHDVFGALVRAATKNGLDTLYIAGDIANSPFKTVQFVDKFVKATHIPVQYIFGNHEYYETAKDWKGARNLQANIENIISPTWGIIADTGWYDYSWAKFGSLGQLMKGKTPTGTWSDHRWIKWPADVVGDPATWFTTMCVNSMEAQNHKLDQLGIDNKIVMLHMIPHYKLLAHDPQYMYTNAFFGAQPTSDLITKIAPKYCFYGHTHFANYTTIDNTDYICSPLGYYFEWPDDDIDTTVEKKLFVLEI